MNFNLQPDERLLREGAANRQRGIETVGGKLFPTNQRLYFQSHSFNVQTGAMDIPLPQVRGARPCWTRFLGVFPLLPNSLLVETLDGSGYRFVLFRRAAWAAAIGAAADA